MLKLIRLSVIASLFCVELTHAGEKSLYDFLWLDPDKKVYVLQNKLYKKEHTFYADLGYLSNFTSKFQSTNGFQIKTGYYFHEEWGMELFYNQYANSNNDDYDNIKTVNAVDPFIRRFNNTYGAVLVWSPFYGKINTFNKIFYFDWSFGAGIARINTESNAKTVGAGANVMTTYEREKYTGAVLKTNVKFHVTERIHLSAEFMNTYYKAPGPQNPKQDKLRTNSDLIFSVGFSF